MIAPDYNLANSPPIISNFVSEIQIFEKEYKQVVVAEVSDNESNESLTIITKAECLNKPSDWIDSSLSTKSTIIL